jgi:hypothetical protein
MQSLIFQQRRETTPFWRTTKHALALLSPWIVLFALCAADALHSTWADTLWDHNGSLLYLRAEGTLREFHYKEPRPGMLQEGVHPSTLLFRGESDNHRYFGTAFIFSSRCGQPVLFIPRGRLRVTCKLLGTPVGEFGKVPATTRG